MCMWNKQGTPNNVMVSVLTVLSNFPRKVKKSEKIASLSNHLFVLVSANFSPTVMKLGRKHLWGKLNIKMKSEFT